jgi:flagellin-like hook-associated protein FlgL
MSGMRITSSASVRRYINSLHQNFRRKNDAESRIIANRKFTRASQNPMDAARALRNRKAMSEVATYQRNLEVAKGIYDAAEGAVQQISGIMQDLQQALIRGATGTYTLEQKEIIALEIDSLAEQMVRLMNLVQADRRIFGGVENSNRPPYDIRNGVVFFNGEPVNRYQDPSLFPNARTSFLDVGLGLAWLDEYTIDPQTAIPVTFNGAAILGSGVSGTNYILDFDVLASSVNAFSFAPEPGENYEFNVVFNNVAPMTTFSFTGSVADLQDELDVAFGLGNVVAEQIGDDVIIRSNNPSLSLNVALDSSSPDTTAVTRVSENITHEVIVTLGSEQRTVRFTTGATDSDTIANLNASLASAFGGGRVVVGNSGMFFTTDMINQLSVHAPDASNLAGIGGIKETPGGFPRNIIQLTLDAAISVRNGTDSLTARYADMIFASQSYLSLSIAAIGSEQAFIEFNQERLMNNMTSLKELENHLEYPDFGFEIMNQKMLEMIYNATLQLSAATIPMSIFNFMR